MPAIKKAVHRRGLEGLLCSVPEHHSVHFQDRHQFALGAEWLGQTG
jgi:hypothetical protein